MEGVAERERKAIEKIVLQAWWNANLDGAGSKLRQPKYYLDQLKVETKEERRARISAAFRALQARGADIRISHIGPDGRELN